MSRFFLHSSKPTTCDLRIVCSTLLMLGLATFNVYAQTCPDTSNPGTERPVASSSKIDFSQIPIQFSFDGGTSILNGASHLAGAQLTQGARTITADTLHYDFADKTVKADGNVTYEDSQFRVSGSDASMDASAGVQFGDARFTLKARSGRGSAAKIELSPQGNLHLDTVRYTTCPANKPDWELKLSDLDINQSTRTGTGRNVRLEFKDIPIFYTPWISFPVGNERKSGFLFPNFRSSSRGGYSLLIPWYWNIAPSYDATFTPIIDSLRGAELDSEFRYLSELSNGIVNANYLPHDPTQHDWRGLLQVKHVTDFNSHYRLQLNGTTVSDNQWFEDFGQSRDETSQVYLGRKLDFSAYGTNWFGSVAIQNLQTLDTQIIKNQPEARPYTAVPQVTITGREHQLPFGLDFDFDGELTYFTRNDLTYPHTGSTYPNIDGARLFVAPELSLPLRTPGMYVVPSASWRYTAYQLSPNEAYLVQLGTTDMNRHPTLSAPVSSLDMAMTFERLSSGEQRLFTLQPRVLYVNTPYRKQADLPVFDTALPDFNLIQLFRTDRFVGPDRLGDTNQISTGVTARMLDAHSGRQVLSGTLGQAFYLRAPCIVTLDSPDACNPTQSTNSSPVIGQVALSAYRNWTASMGIQWDPVKQQTDRREVTFQYLPAHNKVVNLSYRYVRAIGGTNSSLAALPVNSTNPAGVDQTNSIDQWESSFAWPVGINWSTYGRAVYSRLDDKLHDYLGGIEYRSCCWNLRLVFGRSITTREGKYDTRINLQFEFKGLGSAGTADASLQNAIPGYSPHQN